MLDELTPRQLQEWRAYLDGTGEDDGWRQAAMITAAVFNGFQSVQAMFGGKPELIDEEDLAPHFQDANRVPPKLRRMLEGSMSDADIAAALRTVGGQHG